MKKILLSSVFVFSLLSLQSCNEDNFLDTEPTEYVGNPPADRKVYGIYANLIREFTAGTSDHEDFGQKGVDIMLDMIQSDVALSRNVYSRYRDLASLAATQDYTSRFNTIPWNYYYKIAYSANDVIENVDETNFNNIDEQYAYGQALALRGYAYFYLLQSFTKEYNPTAKAIPLVLSTRQEQAASVNQEVIYQQIITDLTKADVLLEGFEKDNTIYVDQDVVNGLLAYTYAAMGNHDKAAEHSLKVINSGYAMATPALLTGGFNNVEKYGNNWLWGADITTDMGLDLVSWWGQMDMYTYSYQSVGDYKCIDKDLLDAIPEGDIRKTQFGIHNAGGVQYWMPLNKFYDAGKRIQGARVVESDYIFMRVDEFYLLYAESMAKKGNLTEAKNYLKLLLENRFQAPVEPQDPDYWTPFAAYIDGLGQTALVDEIYKQTRIELWGEGKSYLALKRNRKDAVRGANHVANAGQTIPFSSEALYFKIPQKEVINNPNL